MFSINSAEDACFAISQLISSDLSSEILKEALNQQKEILREKKEENFTPLSAVVVDPSFALNNDAEDVDEFDGFSDTQRQYDGGEVEIGEEDEKLLAAFMSTKSRPQLTLVAIIVQRIKKKEAEVTSGQFILLCYLCDFSLFTL
ncbi:unnamed protein product [Musa textilis]